MNYFDTSYLVRLYFEEPGWEKVRELRTAEPWACSLHGRAETLVAFHRKFREQAINPHELDLIVCQFEADCERGEFHWLGIEEKTVSTLAETYRTLPRTIFLRAADALHLACARDHGFKIIYSNDKNLLAAARHFGIKGRNVIR